MAEYRVPEFTAAQRAAAVRQMLVPRPQRQWGTVSELARQYGVSRTLLYELRDRALDAIAQAVLPRESGRPAQSTTVEVDKEFIDRAIAILPILKGSVRDIQLGLELLLGVTRSVGYISQTLTVAGEQAAARNREVNVPRPVLGEADEIFQGRKPCLTVVDGRSFLVLNLTPAESRDGTTWGLAYLDLVERGVQFHDLTSDGGSGLRAGVREAELAIPLRPDLFHLLRDARRHAQRLERAAYRAIKTAERARRADLQARGLISRRGRPLKVEVSLSQAVADESAAIAAFDNYRWLLGEIRQALEPITPEQQVVSVAEARATIETAVELLAELHDSAITAFAADLREKLPELLAPLEWVAEQLAVVFEGVEVEDQVSILWAWQHRDEVEWDSAADFPAALQPVVQAAWGILDLFHRSSSLAESLHSWLRPYLQIHRSMPRWLLPMLQLYWNHHRFERGRRAGHSPLELAGVENPLSLMEVFGQLLDPRTATQPA